MSEKKFVDFVKEIIKKIQRYVEETKSVLVLISPNSIGKIADNINTIDMCINDMSKIKEPQKEINKIKLMYQIKNTLNDSIETLKSDQIVKNVILNRSFTFVEDIKRIQNSILSAGEVIQELYKNATIEIMKKYIIKDKESAEKLFDQIILINNTSVIVDILLIIMPGNEFFQTAKVKNYINKLLDNIIKLDIVPTDTAKLLMNTYPIDFSAGPIEESINKHYSIGESDGKVSINTGNVIRYNLQGMVSAGWVNKNKLGTDNLSGLCIETIKRLTTISDLSIVNGGNDDDVAGQYATITYGGPTYNLLYSPPSNIQEISYANILAGAIADKIVLNPVEPDFDPRKDESIKNDIMVRIKSNVMAELRKLLRTKPSADSINDLVKIIIKACAVGIKDSIFTSEKNIDLLLINMATVTEAYKRVDNTFKKLLNDRFPNITIEELLSKNDLNEIIYSIAGQAVEDINRQPSVLDQLI